MLPCVCYDLDPARLELARQFGAAALGSPNEGTKDAVMNWTRDVAPCRDDYCGH